MDRQESRRALDQSEGARARAPSSFGRACAEAPQTRIASHRTRSVCRRDCRERIHSPRCGQHICTDSRCRRRPPSSPSALPPRYAALERSNGPVARGPRAVTAVSPNICVNARTQGSDSSPPRPVTTFIFDSQERERKRALPPRLRIIICTIVTREDSHGQRKEVKERVKG